MPGVTYEKSVQFTPHGPVVAHVLRGPRPVGLYALKPILSNDAIIGREKVTQMQRRLSTTATVAGVNGDLFNLTVGYPSGLLLMNAHSQCAHHHHGAAAAHRGQQFDLASAT